MSTRRLLDCRTLALGTLLLFAATGCMARQIIVCPDAVKLEAATVRFEPIKTGFETYVERSSVRLSGMSAFDGHPREGASLIPSAISKGGSRIIWNFSESHVRDGWVSCDYADGLFRLAHAVGAAAKKCLAIVSTAEPGKALKGRFECE